MAGSFLGGVLHGKYDKTVHFSVSFLLTIIGFSVLPVLWSVALVLLLGIAKELVDATRPGDHFDIFDLATDTVGIAAAVLLWHFIV